MHIGKSYRITEFLGWTRRRAYVVILLGLVPIAAYQHLGWHWLALPWPIAVLLGTATSFIVGFKNVQTYHRVPEHETPLQSVLRKHMNEEELTQVLAVENKPAWLLAMQSDAIRRLYTNQDIVVLHHTEMEKTLKDLLDQQGRVERIKNFPYPRQYAVINTIFVWCFATLLPLTLVREFDKLNDAVGGPLAGQMAWLAAAFGAFVAWLYAALDQVGTSTENPFEGSANDVPISRMCRQLENELRGLAGESGLTPLPAPEGPIVL